MKVAAKHNKTHNPSGETRWVSRLRENLTSGSYGEGLETGRRSNPAPRQSFTRQSGFKELKQEIGSGKSQCRNAQSVTNHLNFCMMATTICWIYADRLKTDPERRHKVKGRTSFAFSDIRRIIAEAALDEDFDRVCPKPGNPTRNSLVAALLRMVA